MIMKIKYNFFDEDGYDSECAMIEDLYPNDPIPDKEDYIKKGTGEIVEFIKGGLLSSDKFLIVDDKTGKFMKIKVSDCTKIND